MKKYILLFFLLFFVFSVISTVSTFSIAEKDKAKPIRVLIVTGNHVYNKESFNAMFSSFGNTITYQVAEFPSAFKMFSTSDRNKYDVLVFYHMWQNITEEQKVVFADCIRQGKPLVVLHHSICAFDDWEEYRHITGGKYFHKPAMLDGKEYPACSYIHDIHFRVNVVDEQHPVTKGVNDFDFCDETYKGYWVEPGANPLLTTTDTTSTPVIGWTKTYGKARIVTLQSGHDSSAFQNPNYRKILIQAIEWAYNNGKKY